MIIHAPQQPILLVEDNPEDVITAKRNLHKSGLRNPVQACETGELALDYLYHRGNFAAPNSAPIPGVILLDLILPDMEGIAILRDIKQNPQLRSIPVIIMTSSPDKRDFEESYRAGADNYFAKPVDFIKLIHAIRQHPAFTFELMFFHESEDQEEIAYAHS